MNNAKEFSGIKFDGIQILRAISALMVALYHIDFIYNLKINTAIGVDIFFVISGFIIMYTTQSNLDNYAKKRIIKISNGLESPGKSLRISTNELYCFDCDNS